MVVSWGQVLKWFPWSWVGSSPSRSWGISYYTYVLDPPYSNNNTNKEMACLNYKLRMLFFFSKGSEIVPQLWVGFLPINWPLTSPLVRDGELDKIWPKPFRNYRKQKKGTQMHTDPQQMHAHFWRGILRLLVTKQAKATLCVPQVKAQEANMHFKMDSKTMHCWGNAKAKVQLLL